MEQCAAADALLDGQNSVIIVGDVQMGLRGSTTRTMTNRARIRRTCSGDRHGDAAEIVEETSAAAPWM